MEPVEQWYNTTEITGSYEYNPHKMMGMGLIGTIIIIYIVFYYLGRRYAKRKMRK